MKYQDSLQAADLIVARVKSGSLSLQIDHVARALRNLCRGDFEDGLRVLLVQLPELRKDAERYRWIAAQGCCPFKEQDEAWDDKAKLDALIDEFVAAGW